VTLAPRFRLAGPYTVMGIRISAKQPNALVIEAPAHTWTEGPEVNIARLEVGQLHFCPLRMLPIPDNSTRICPNVRF